MDAVNKGARGAPFRVKPSDEANRCWVIEEFHGWNLVSIKDRIDSFNQTAFQNDLSQLLATSRRPLAIEVSLVRFLSLTAIKFLDEVAIQGREMGLRLALVAPSEKLKRQIDIYAKLERWEIFRNTNGLAEGRAETPAFRHRSDGPLAGI